MEPHAQPRASNLVVSLYQAFFIIALVGVLSGFVNSYWWVFEVLSSFRVQYALILGLGAVLAFHQRRPRLVMLALMAFAANGCWLFPYVVSSESGSGHSSSLKVSTLNVHTANTRWDLVLGFIASRSPDIAFFTEVNEEWVSRLKPLEKIYPFSISKPRADNFGVALYSKIPPQRLEIHEFLSGELPSVLMTFLKGSETITLVGTHPLPPRTPAYSACRNSQIDTIAAFFSRIPRKKILIGDLNTAPWADLFQNLLRVGGLRDTALGRGIQVTWPKHAWWLLGVPIDHCLISPDLTVISRSIDPEVGSDHYPIFVELGIP